MNNVSRYRVWLADGYGGGQWTEVVKHSDYAMLEATLTGYAATQHPDDQAVDLFAGTMKAKLAASREKGRNGWQTASAAYLSALLYEHMFKADPVDVANIAMMLFCNGQNIELPQQARGNRYSTNNPSQNEPWRAFAVELMRGALAGGSYDGGDIQDIALRHGIMTVEERNSACGENCACAEFGFPAQCHRIVGGCPEQHEESSPVGDSSPAAQQAPG